MSSLQSEAAGGVAWPFLADRSTSGTHGTPDTRDCEDNQQNDRRPEPPQSTRHFLGQTARAEYVERPKRDDGAIECDVRCPSNGRRKLDEISHTLGPRIVDSPRPQSTVQRTRIYLVCLAQAQI